MKFLHEGFNTKDIEKTSKNKWRWEWLFVCDRNGDNYGNWLEKPDVPGVAFCTVLYVENPSSMDPAGKKELNARRRSKPYEKQTYCET